MKGEIQYTETEKVSSLLSKDILEREDLVTLLNCEGEEKELLFRHADAIRRKHAGALTYFRGLIELSNICHKNCLYCGIRSGNREVKRYSMTDDEVMQAVSYAVENRYGSIVLQSGELTSRSFVLRIERLLRNIHRFSGGNLRITLSCGEQSRDTYQRWFESGASRYLLRIESSNPLLYEKLHPQDGKHLFRRRMECLKNLQETGYQTGTGVMIGLPFQTKEDLAGDLMFMKEFDMDMVGMGPYLEHPDTPLYTNRHLLAGQKERLELSLKMVALLRIIMKDINIAAATALQAIDPSGRESALQCGANVIMPNITPAEYKPYYLLYEGKPCLSSCETIEEQLHENLAFTSENSIAWDEWGDSLHYQKRIL